MARKTKQQIVKEEMTEEIVQPVEEVIETVDSSEVVVEEENVDEQLFVSLISKIQAMSVEVKSVMSIVKNLQKENVKLRKLAEKRKSKKKKGGEPKKSGFSIPVKVTNELADFLKIESGTLICRRDVTKGINSYIKENELYDTNDKRVIKPNETLIKLLNVGDGETVSYFNLQKYIKHHFIKDVPVQA